MSYDLRVWTSAPPELPLALPEPERWQLSGGLWRWRGRGWQIVVGPIHRVDQGDIPAEVRAALAGGSHMVDLNLEPSGAPRSALALLNRIAKAMAIASHGVVLDPQRSTVRTPGGVKRFVAAPKRRTLDAIALSWFFVTPALRSREGIEQTIACMDRWIPEALPVRYGAYEPPSFRYSETGRDHFIDFLAEEYVGPTASDSCIWFPKRPVLTVELSLESGPSWRQLAWRSQHLAIVVESSVLSQPGWTTTLKGLWRDMATIVRPFYADARTLRGFMDGAASIDEMIASGRHPVRAAFWAGIPRSGGHAVALGGPYRGLWPEFEALAERADVVAIVSKEDWSTPDDVFAQIGAVPEALADQSVGGNFLDPLEPIYPTTWPFGPTHVERPK